MENITPRERIVLAAMTGFARRFGRWASVRELGAYIGREEGRPGLSVASTVAMLYRKGAIAKHGRNYAVKGLHIQVVKVKLVEEKNRASADALSR